MSSDQAIIQALKTSFAPSYFAQPANLSWKSAVFGVSSSTTPKPILVDMVLMLQPSILKATGFSLADKAKAATAVIDAINNYSGSEPLGLKVVENNFGKKQIVIIENNFSGSAGEQISNVASSSSSSAVAVVSNQQQQQQTSIDAAPASSSSLATNSPEEIDARTIFASPIHYRATETEVAEFFSQFGKVASVERRKFVERGITKLKPSVFVTFASKEDAEKCVAARPTYGRCTSQLGSMFIPRLTVSRKGDPTSRDAMADEDLKKQYEGNRNGGQRNNNNNNDDDDGATKDHHPHSNNNGPSHRKLISKGLVCIARGIPQDEPQGTISAKLGQIQGIAGNKIIDIVHMPSTAQQQELAAKTGSDPSKKMCYVYCTSALAATTLINCYNRVFQNQEKFAESLGKSVPSLEKCTNANEEELAMELYPDAVADRTQRKMEKNAQHGGGGAGHQANNNNRIRQRE